MQFENKIIDLFCGCGGFSLGAHQAGFETSVAIDIDETLSSAYKLNFPLSKVKNLDIAKVSRGEIAHALRPLGIIGGPPCQGFSLIGKRNVMDPRNNLLEHYFRLVRSAQPGFFVMENVPGLMIGHGRDLLTKAMSGIAEDFHIVGPFEVNAADFGAATKRKRIIIIGFHKDLGLEVDADVFRPKAEIQPASIRTVFEGIPAPQTPHEVVHGFGWVKSLSKFMPSKFCEEVPGVGNEVAIGMTRIGYFSGVEPTKHTRSVIERFNKTKVGTVEPISRYPRLAWHQQCGTLRAGTGADRGSFQAVRPIHPVEPRVITVREAARIQGFPDWYLFHPTKWHSFRMIGNSVSPIMARHLMEKVHSLIAKRLNLSKNIAA